MTLLLLSSLIFATTTVPDNDQKKSIETKQEALCPFESIESVVVSNTAMYINGTFYPLNGAYNQNRVVDMFEACNSQKSGDLFFQWMDRRHWTILTGIVGIVFFPVLIATVYFWIQSDHQKRVFLQQIKN